MKAGLRSLTLMPFLIATVPSVILLLCAQIRAQSTTSIEGRIIDQNGGLISNAEIKALSRSIGVERTTTSDGSGRYEINAFDVGQDPRYRAVAHGGGRL